MNVNSFSDFLISLDNACDRIPIVSSISSLVNIFQKYIVLSFKTESTIETNHYYAHLKQKNFSRCVLLTVPFLGNLLVGIGDFKQHLDNYDNADFMLAAIEQNPCNFNSISLRLKKDGKFLADAFSRNKEILKFLSYEMQQDEDFLKNFFALGQLKENRRYFLSVINTVPRAINFIGDDLIKNKEFLLSAISFNPLVVSYLKQELLTEELLLEIIRANPEALRSFQKKICTDKVFLLKAIQVNPLLVKHLGRKECSWPEVENLNFLIEAIEAEPLAFLHVVDAYNIEEYAYNVEEYKDDIEKNYDNREFFLHSIAKQPRTLEHIRQVFKGKTLERILADIERGDKCFREKYAEISYQPKKIERRGHISRRPYF